MDEKRTNKNKPKKHRWLKIALAVIFVVVLGLFGYVYSIYSNAKETVDEKIHNPMESIDQEIGKKKISEKKPLNILLLGVDKRPGDSGRSDALMVLSLKPDEDKMQIISIPRDTRTTIVGRGYKDKINHAYAFGVTDMSIATVESLLDIELDYYVEMNMQGLSKLVDAVGGITVNNSLDWYDEGYYKKDYHYQKGKIQLNGPKTMGYVRMRHLDPRGDFGRTERQRQVIQAIIDKGASFSSVGKIGDILDVLGKNMATNMDFDDMKNLFLNYRGVRKHVSTYMLKGNGTKMDGIYYLIVPDEEIEKVHEMILEGRVKALP